MNRIMKLVLGVLTAVVAFGAMTAASALAAEGHPLFITASGKALLFTGINVAGSVPILRGLNNGVLGSVTCEKSLAHGFVLNKSTLARNVKLTFEGKCLQNISGVQTTCSEPIVVKEVFGELGLASATVHTVLTLLAPESGTEFVKITCALDVTTVEGAIVGLIPATNALGENQYNVARTELELIFTAENKGENQALSEIFLLGTQKTGALLTVKGFLGGMASQETTAELKSDGLVTISF